MVPPCAFGRTATYHTGMTSTVHRETNTPD
jgi:hypothetical protein